MLQSTAPLIDTVDEAAVFLGTTLADLGMVSGETINVSWNGVSTTITTGPGPGASIPDTGSTALLLGAGLLGLAAIRRKLS